MEMRKKLKDEVIAYHRANRHATAIQAAMELGVSAEYIRKTAHRYGLRFKRAIRRNIAVSDKVIHVLDGEAAMRDMTLNELTSRILSAVIEDNLINAILDDGDDYDTRNRASMAAS